MSIRVIKKEAYIHNIHTRMPFRYGIAEMTAVPHLFLKLECEIEGQACFGISAQSLIPKWFTKSPESEYVDEVSEMIEVIDRACEFAVGKRDTNSLFDLWLGVYQDQAAWAKEAGYPSLLWNMGVSLVEQALMDAFCRQEEVTLAEAVSGNLFEIRLDEIHPVLAGISVNELLPDHPLGEINIRHTVGLSDYLTEDEIPEGERVSDGLPQSLEANIQKYALKYFKIKINGDLDRDLARLCSIDQVLRANWVTDYWFTLDGNEQYQTVSEFRSFWETLTAPDNCSLDLARLLFVEQPFHRKVALDDQTGADLLAWSDRPLMIIDESDSEIRSLKKALENGYAGTSHKNCKGIFKSIANASYLNWMKSQEPEREFILSGEDLVNIGPVALMQDLAVMALLGIEHVERNGHHYFAGMSIFPAEVQANVLDTYPDIYQKGDVLAYLDIQDGKIGLESINRNSFGGANEIGPEKWFQPKNNWTFESLEI